MTSNLFKLYVILIVRKILLIRHLLCNYDWIRTNSSFTIKSVFQLNLCEVPPTNGLIIICEVQGFEPCVCTCTTLTRPLQELQLCYNLCIDLYAFPLAIMDNGIEPLLLRIRDSSVTYAFSNLVLVAFLAQGS